MSTNDIFDPTSTAVPPVVAANFAGPWGTAAPGPTSGISFTCPGGVLRGVASCTAYATTQSGILVFLWINGVNTGASMALQSTHPISTHCALSTMAFAVVVQPGVNYIAFQQTAGVSDTGDRGSFFGVVTPN